MCNRTSKPAPYGASRNDGPMTDLPVTSSPPAKNISLRLEVETVLLGCPSRLDTRGVCAIVTKREAGCDGRKRRTRRMRIACGRRSRVVLTSRRWRQVGGSHFADDGDKNARSPGRPRRKPLKPFAQGRPDEFGEPVVTTLVCSSCFACEAAGAVGRPAFPAPSLFRRDVMMHDSGGIPPRERGVVPVPSFRVAACPE
jgi:hypothetical protein